MTTVHERVYHLHITHTQPYRAKSREELKGCSQRARAVHVGRLLVIGGYLEVEHGNGRGGWCVNDQWRDSGDDLLIVVLVGD